MDSPPAENNDEDLCDVKVVENPRQKSREEGFGQQGEEEVLPRQAPPIGPLLDPPTNIRI